MDTPNSNPTQRDSAYHYRMKAPNPLHWGPYAILMRECAVRSKEMGCHDYLRTPEIVEDICRAYVLESGVDLAPAYHAATTPCVVKFSDPERKEYYLTTAIVHLFHRFHGCELTMDCNTCLDMKTQPIRAEDILKIEIIDETCAGPS
jgi:hypothetical protein